jgi:RNA-binding protein YlmH
MSDGLYVHFHKDEHPFVDRWLEWLARVEQYHEPRWSDFLDPRQAFIAESLTNRTGSLQLSFAGGYPTAERRRARIAPDYMSSPTPEEAPLALFHLYSLDTRLAKLRHGDYLGALLGLGLKREKIGDLHVFEDGCYVLVANEMAEFVELHMNQVHRASIQLTRLPLAQLQVSEPALQIVSLSVSSLRLDGILSDVFRMSRAKAVLPIKAGRCKVNWRIEESPAAALQEGDVVSLQGFGRFRVVALEGTTKKGNMRLKIGLFV